MANAINLGKVMGSRMLFVASTPGPDLGLQDDWAFDTASGKVWQKTSAGWVYRGNIKEGNILSINGLVADEEGKLSIGAADVGAATPENVKKSCIDSSTYTVLKEGTSQGEMQLDGLTMPFTGYLAVIADNGGTQNLIDITVYLPKISILQYISAAGKYDRTTVGFVKVEKGSAITGHITSGKSQMLIAYKAKIGE